jgi:hypothetical protein
MDAYEHVTVVSWPLKYIECPVSRIKPARSCPMLCTMMLSVDRTSTVHALCAKENTRADARRQILPRGSCHDCAVLVVHSGSRSALKASGTHCIAYSVLEEYLSSGYEADQEWSDISIVHHIVHARAPLPPLILHDNNSIR